MVGLLTQSRQDLIIHPFECNIDSMQQLLCKLMMFWTVEANKAEAGALRAASRLSGIARHAGYDLVR